MPEDEIIEELEEISKLVEEVDTNKDKQKKPESTADVTKELEEIEKIAGGSVKAGTAQNVTERKEVPKAPKAAPKQPEKAPEKKEVPKAPKAAPKQPEKAPEKKEVPKKSAKQVAAAATAGATTGAVAGAAKNAKKGPQKKEETAKKQAKEKPPKAEKTKEVKKEEKKEPKKEEKKKETKPAAVTAKKAKPEQAIKGSGFKYAAGGLIIIGLIIYGLAFYLRWEGWRIISNPPSSVVAITGTLLILAGGEVYYRSRER